MNDWQVGRRRKIICEGPRPVISGGFGLKAREFQNKDTHVPLCLEEKLYESQSFNTRTPGTVRHPWDLHQTHVPQQEITFRSPRNPETENTLGHLQKIAQWKSEIEKILESEHQGRSDSPIFISDDDRHRQKTEENKWKYSVPKGQHNRHQGYSERRALNDSYERVTPRDVDNIKYDDPIVVFSGQRSYLGDDKNTDVKSFTRRQSTRGRVNIMPSYRDLINQLRS